MIVYLKFIEINYNYDTVFEMNEKYILYFNSSDYKK